MIVNMRGSHITAKPGKISGISECDYVPSTWIGVSIHLGNICDNHAFSLSSPNVWSNKIPYVKCVI